MQDPRSTSTLELVVNEQQLHNMSQIDLSRPDDFDQQRGQSSNANQNNQESSGFSFQCIKELPQRLRTSLSSKFEEAKSNSESKTELALNIVRAYYSIVMWTICYVSLVFLPIVLFLVGLANLNDCPDRPALPYVVYAMGFTLTACNLFNLACTLKLHIFTNHRLLTDDLKSLIANIINIILNIVFAFFFIMSASIVYTMEAHGKHDSASNSNSTTESPPPEEIDESADRIINGDAVDCSPILYGFTYWFITLTLGILALAIIVATALFAYSKHKKAIIRGSTPRSQVTVSIDPSPHTTNTRA